MMCRADTTSVIRKKFSQECGVAMITVIILSSVLMMLGGGMYLITSRGQRMTQADFAGGQAFYYAEGGLETTLDALQYAVTESQLTLARADQSSDGYGYLMDPNPASRQDPTDPVLMNIGNESYAVWIDQVDQDGNHCEDCGLNLASADPAYLLITAEGQSAEGYRMLQQQVKVEASGIPMSLYIDGDAEINGTPSIIGQSMFVKGSVYGREKISVTGQDLVYGGDAGVLATGTIYAKSNGGNSQIYTAGQQSSYWDAAYVNDRDSRGPAGNKFTVTELNNLFATGGISTAQLGTLKAMAMTDGYYANPDSGGLTINQGDLPSHDGNIVVYVEYADGAPETNEVDLKFTWPDEYPSGKALVIIRNGSAKMTGNDIGHLTGFVYCPDGPVAANGSGNGDFTGAVWAKGLTNMGNFPFNMTVDFLEDPPFFTWTVVRMTEWTEVDR